MSNNPHLETALAAERFIHQFEKKTDNGLVWSLAKEKPEVYLRTLYAGSAGIALFYLELFDATGDKQFLEKATLAGEDLVAYVTKKTSLTCSALGGWAGYLFVLNEIALRTEDSSFTRAARHAGLKLRNQASEIGAGLGWIAPMPYADLTGEHGLREIFDVAEGAAGIGLYYLYAHEHQIIDDSLAWVRSIADRLLEVAQEAEGGLRWQLMEDIPWPFDAPNFAHGTAGVAYLMARTFEATGDRRYLDAAIAGAGHVKAVADPIGEDGHLVPHILDDGRPHRYYLGMCHGPAGTARLFYLLSRMTNDQQWLEWSKGLDRGFVNLGAPEERGRGFWNNISQCCCDAGIGDHALFMYRSTGDSFYLELAERVAKEIMNRSETDQDKDTICWPQAEHRSQPEFIETQTGYMQGAAGVGSFFIHLATIRQGNPTKIVFPDAPYAHLG